MTDVDLAAMAETMQVVAWVGPDEFDDSRGIKSALTPVGWIPLAFKEEHLDRATRPNLRDQLQQQANKFGKPMALVRFGFLEVVETVEPQR